MSSEILIRVKSVLKYYGVTPKIHVWVEGQFKFCYDFAEIPVLVDALLTRYCWNRRIVWDTVRILLGYSQNSAELLAKCC